MCPSLLAENRIIEIMQHMSSSRKYSHRYGAESRRGAASPSKLSCHLAELNRVLAVKASRAVAGGRRLSRVAARRHRRVSPRSQRHEREASGGNHAGAAAPVVAKRSAVWQWHHDIARHQRHRGAAEAG